MYGFSKLSVNEGVDLEKGDGSTLYPGLSLGENELRWGFIRKVYSILAAQLVLTTFVAGFTVLYTPLNAALAASPGLSLGLAFVPLFLLCPLYYYQHRHPLNFVFLGLFTVCLSITVGVACANTKGKLVFEALILTSGVLLALTAYTFWAVKRGQDFGYLGPFLFACVIALLLTGLVQIFFPLGSLAVAIYSGFGAIIFAGYIVYDTDQLIKRYTYDDYIWASVALYLDILNLFLYILQMLRSGDN